MMTARASSNWTPTARRTEIKPWGIFLVLSWSFVLGLVSWAYWRLLSDQGQKHFDPDGVGPASPAAPGRATPKKGKK